MISRRNGLLAAGAALGVAALPGRASAVLLPEDSGGEGWAGSWGAAACSGTTELGSGALTVRNIVHTSLGGPEIRIRVSNAFGTAPLAVTAVTVGLPSAAGGAAASSIVPVTFDGAGTVTIPAGAEVVSDPVTLAVPAAADLLISVAIPADSGPATFHLHATQVNYVAAGDDHAADLAATAFTTTTASWFYVTGVDVRSSGETIVALGDSITDGVTSTVGANHRWPDYLARRLRLGVLNAGISGNRVLLDGSALAAGYAAAGQSAVARVQRDVLSRTGVRTLILFEGINDLIWQPSQLDPEAIIGGLRQIILQAHAVGVRVVNATLTPAGGYTGGGFGTPQEAVRQAVNAWIRDSGIPDAVADFDAVLRDPADPGRIAPKYDSGDNLHPNDAGYQALADSIKLSDLR
jgi:lysophospholipase L1-like esterase